METRGWKEGLGRRRGMGIRRFKVEVEGFG